MMPLKVLAVCIMTFISVVSSRTVNLFGADPAGGLWGARIDTEADRGDAETDAYSGYKSAVFNKNINVASYDKMTGKVLFHTAASVSSSASLYYGPLCTANRKAPKFLTDLSVVPIASPELGDCVNCETSGFVIYNGRIYFLLFGEYFSLTGDAVTRVVQIRTFKPCNRCREVGEKFSDEVKYKDIVTCSKLVVEVIKERFTFSDFDDQEIKGGKGMKVVPEGDQLHFFFQLGNISRSDRAEDIVSISLWHAGTDGSVQELHSDRLASKFSSWDMRALGSVDYLDKTVCWTAGDRLFCGGFDNNRLKDQKMLIMPGDVAAKGVCKGSELENLAVVSGVAMMKGGPTPSLVFGCYPQSPGTGGIGILKFKDGKGVMIPLGTQDMGPLLAGSVFITDSFDQACQWNPEPDICLGQPRPTLEPEPEPEPETENFPPRPESPTREKEVDPEGNEVDPEENGIEGGHNESNKVTREEGSAVVGSTAESHCSSVISFFTLFIVLLLS